ncbi:MAG: FAD/NAD(P)-binding protein [Chloroflexi bacterium]|nr:FAD/NAD(P)-binding protein [Chloroflexota bacterium]
MSAFPDNGHAVLIGGGPAGAACALALQRQAALAGRSVRITVLEGKQFGVESHYNQCVGVLSPPLAHLMEEELGVPFPAHLSRGEITGYVVHTDREEIVLDGDRHPSTALRRVHFDAYMLDAVRERGIPVLTTRAVDLEFHADYIVVYTESMPLQADVVVGAFGLDEGSAAIFSRLTGYRPPSSLASVVTKYHPGPAEMAAFGSRIHAFLPAEPSIEFGGVTPKGNHLTINIVGDAVDVKRMQEFLDMPSVRAVLPNLDNAGAYDANDLRFFKGRFPCSLAHGYYGDRFVLVGDAAGLVRAFKGKGVTSGVLTGIRAAHTIVQAGISRQAFHDAYRSANHDIISDLPFGRTMRVLTIWFARLGLLDPLVRAAHQDANLQAALFDAVSAHAPYRQVMARILRPRTLLSILGQMLTRGSRPPLGAIPR